MSREERLKRRKIWNRRYKERHPEKCKRIQDESNRKRRDAMKQWQKENPERYAEKKREWYERNKELAAERAREYARQNPEWKAAQCAKRRSRKKRAVPVWFDEAQVQTLYEKASEYGLHVDHIVPLKSKKVCGLHCWENLQLLHPSENSTKGNRCWPDM